MNKRLLITSTELMMVQFLIPHVIHLSQNGFVVEVACSNVGGRIDEVFEKLKDHVEAIHTVRLTRNPVSTTNFKGYGDMRKVIENGKYDIIWTNEPVMGVVTRLAARNARKRGTKVLYMVHGFHFYKGAPALNWILFYPAEHFASHFCDGIVTINREDEARAKKMHTPYVKYIHGIGVNTDRLHSRNCHTNIRNELGLTQDAFIVLSVGELNPNKNHQVVIKAIANINDPQIHYLICGKGPLYGDLQKLALDCGVNQNVHFLGYRQDVMDIYSQADIMVFPSIREGLGLAGLEAMFCGLPLITSTASGPKCYMEEDYTGFMYNYDDALGFAEGIKKLKNNSKLRQTIGEHNRIAMKPFTLEAVRSEILELLNAF